MHLYDRQLLLLLNYTLPHIFPKFVKYAALPASAGRISKINVIKNYFFYIKVAHIEYMKVLIKKLSDILA